MIRFTIILIWFYLIVEFITQFVLSYTYVDLSNRQRALEINMQRLQLEDKELEYKVASSSSLLNAEQSGTRRGFQIPRKDQIIKI